MNYTETRKMLWTDIEICVISDDWNTPNVMNWVFQYFRSFEQEFSRFLPHSNLSMLNEFKKFKVSWRFIDLLNISKDMYAKTDRFFNPLVDLSSIWYSHDFSSWDFEKLERKSSLDLNEVVIDWNEVKMWENDFLDFGWIGKWYAAWEAAKIFKIFWYDNFYINAGGDIYASWLNEDWQKWVVWIENPFDRSLLWYIKISDKAVATSWSYIRNWNIWWKNYHHIINPKNAENESDIVNVTVIADKWYEADAFTKSIFNMKATDSIEFMKKNNLAWMIITKENELVFSYDFEDIYEFTLIKDS